MPGPEQRREGRKRWPLLVGAMLVAAAAGWVADVATSPSAVTNRTTRVVAKGWHVSFVGGAFNAVSCASSTFCVAVSAYEGTSSADVLGGSTWSGPKLLLENSGVAVSLACPADRWCVALTDLGKATVLDAGVWSKPTTVDGFPGSSIPGMIASVACASTESCVAVDGEGKAATFDGRTWTVPSLIDAAYPLNAVSCEPDGSCVAVDGDGRALVFHKGRWSTPRSVDDTALTSVACAPHGFCVAVDALARAVVFNGTSWSTPNAIDPVSRAPLSVSSPVDRTCITVDPGGMARVLQNGTWGRSETVDPRGRWAAVTPSLVAVSCARNVVSLCAAVDNFGNVLAGGEPFALR